MKNFFEYNFNISQIVFACYVPKGEGEIIISTIIRETAK